MSWKMWILTFDGRPCREVTEVHHTRGAARDERKRIIDGYGELYAAACPRIEVVQVGPIEETVDEHPKCTKTPECAGWDGHHGVCYPDLSTVGDEAEGVNDEL